MNFPFVRVIGVWLHTVSLSRNVYFQKIILIPGSNICHLLAWVLVSVTYVTFEHKTFFWQLAPVEMYVVSLVGGGFHLRYADTDVGVPTCK